MLPSALLARCGSRAQVVVQVACLGLQEHQQRLTKSPSQSKQRCFAQPQGHETFPGGARSSLRRDTSNMGLVLIASNRNAVCFPCQPLAVPQTLPTSNDASPYGNICCLATGSTGLCGHFNLG